MLRRFKTPIIIVVTALLTQGVGLAVQAAMPDSLRPAGSTRYAMVQSTTEDFDGGGDVDYENVVGMATSITIPANKKGDVMVVFCTMSDSAAPTSFAVRALVGAMGTGPGSLYLDSDTTLVNDCAVFCRLNVAAGTKNVRMQWFALIPTTLYARSMIVTVNIHD